MHDAPFPNLLQGILGNAGSSLAADRSPFVISPDTVRCWEKGRRVPSGPALRLLQIARKHPQLLASA